MITDRRQLEIFYRAAAYQAEDAGVDFDIRFDSDNAELQRFLSERRASCWAFLTAYNPYSEPLPESENELRQTALANLLDQEKYSYLKGCGRGDDWSEPSFLILDIPRDKAISIGKRFQQNAILWGSIGQGAELIWCVDSD